MEIACRQHSLAMVYLVAPTSTPQRLALATKHSTGFLYLVSVTGITGARSDLPSHLAGFIASVREHTDLHLAVGFGIGTPGQAKAVGKLADGVVVGSALVRKAGQPEPRQRVFNLAVSLARAAHGEATD